MYDFSKYRSVSMARTYVVSAYHRLSRRVKQKTCFEGYRNRFRARVGIGMRRGSFDVLIDTMYVVASHAGPSDPM